MLINLQCMPYAYLIVDAPDYLLELHEPLRVDIVIKCSGIRTENH